MIFDVINALFADEFDEIYQPSALQYSVLYPYGTIYAT